MLGFLLLDYGVVIGIPGFGIMILIFLRLLGQKTFEISSDFIDSLDSHSLVFSASNINSASFDLLFSTAKHEVILGELGVPDFLWQSGVSPVHFNVEALLL